MYHENKRSEVVQEAKPMSIRHPNTIPDIPGLSGTQPEPTGQNLEKSGQIWTNLDTKTHDPQPRTGNPLQTAEIRPAQP